MKLWEILRDGNVGDMFRCVTRNNSYSGYVVIVDQTEGNQKFIRIFILPDGNILKRTCLVELCGDAMNSEWEVYEDNTPIVKFNRNQTKKLHNVIQRILFNSYNPDNEQPLTKEDHLYLYNLHSNLEKILA